MRPVWFQVRSVRVFGVALAVCAFPYVSEEVLLVDPGSYTLVLWLSPDMGPYSRWVPSAPVTGGCEITFDIDDDVALDVDGRSIGPMTESGSMGSCDLRPS